jgi:hypothetical protein
MKTKEEWMWILYPFTSEQRARAANQLNRWDWPDIIANYKPDRFDSQLPKEKYNDTEFKALYNALNEMVSAWEQSRYHWLDNLNRSEKEHHEWWCSDRSWMAHNTTPTIK